MTVTTITYEQIEGWLGSALFPFLRIGACLTAAPLFSASYIPPRIRIVLAIALTLIILPVLPRTEGLTLLSGDGIVTTVQQIVIAIIKPYPRHRKIIDRRRVVTFAIHPESLLIFVRSRRSTAALMPENICSRIAGSSHRDFFISRWSACRPVEDRQLVAFEP